MLAMEGLTSGGPNLKLTAYIRDTPTCCVRASSGLNKGPTKKYALHLAHNEIDARVISGLF